MKNYPIGVLALQGDFQKHIDMLKGMNVLTSAVRTAAELRECYGLVIPGGESTTIHRHLKESDLEIELQKFSETKPVFGTCAGLILMAQSLLDEGRVLPLKLIDIDIARNAYGRQSESFSAEITVKLDDKHPHPFHAMFIRAPRIQRVGKNVDVLAELDGEPVLVRQGKFLGSTFHPELTHDTAIHNYFVKIVVEAALSSCARARA